MDAVTLAAAAATSRRLAAGPRLLATPGRRAFEMMLSERATRKMIGVYIGASTVEGSVATYDRQMSVLLEKMLQNSYNPPGIPGGYTIKARNGGWATTGTTGETPDVDLKKHRTLVAGATMTHTTRQPVTGLQIHYLEGPGQGQFSVQVDNYPAFIITPDTTKPTDSPTGSWESPVFDRAIRTVVITAIGACSLGNIVFRDGDRDLGFTLYNAGRAGGSTSVFVGAGAATTWQRIAALAPDIVPVQLGHNDLGANSIATYKANLNTIVDSINAASPGKTVWVPMIAQQSTDVRYPDYIAAMKEVAASRSNCTFHDYNQFLQHTQAAVDASTEGLWFTDYTHLVSKGHEFVANLLADSLGLPSRRTWPSTPPVSDNLSYDWTTDPALLGQWDPNALSATTGQSVPSLPVARGSLTAAMTQATAGKQPTIVAGPNGRKALGFSATAQQELATAVFAAQSTPATIFIIWRRSGTTGTRMFSGASSNFLSLQASSGTPYLFRVDNKASNTSVTWPNGPDQNWHLAAQVFNGVNSALFHDSRTPIATTLAASAQPWDSLSLGRNQTGTAWANVEIAGIIAFSRALSSFEVGRLMDYWAAATGIGVI